MTWSYSGDPATSEKDAVRFLVGDTSSKDPLAQDEEVQYILTRSSTVEGAAASVARAIAALFARQVDSTTGSLSLSDGQMQEQYLALATRLERQAANAPKRAGFKTGAPVVTGVSRSEVKAARDNPDRVREVFYRGQFDNPHAGHTHRHSRHH